MNRVSGSHSMIVIDAIIPALDEEGSLPKVLQGLAHRGLRRVIVVDNGSKDRTYAAARAGGADVVFTSERGYGAACLRGLERLADGSLPPPDVVVFLDADGADAPEDLAAVIFPVVAGLADLVIGSRVKGEAEPGALTPVQRFGNALSCALLRLIWDAEFTDLGPFRAVSFRALAELQMQDRDFGWTVEMQAKAARLGLRCVEVPVQYRRRRAGRSKIAGDLRGSFAAGTKILFTIGKEALR